MGIIVSNIVSLDGYVADAEGNSTVLPMDEAFDAYNAERLASADVLLVGAGTYRMFVSFWPAVLNEPERLAEGIAAQVGVPHEEVLTQLTTGASAEVARLNNAIRKIVVSDSFTPDDLGAWRDTTTIVPRDGLKDVDGEAVVFGSRTTWNALLAAGLVDEVHLMLAPVALGSGVPAFDASPSLTLAGTRRFDGSDNVVLRYLTRR